MSIVFTNGCFDILHRGHVELLRFCKSKYPDHKLVVGVKGKNRPVNNISDRVFLLESIRFVDEVIVFSEDTPYNLIRKVNPDIIVKGGDYQPEDVVGNDLCDVVIFNYVKGYSTTKTIQDLGGR